MDSVVGSIGLAYWY